MARLDVGEHERIVGEEVLGTRGVPAGQRIGPRLRRLDVKRVGTLLVLAFAHDRVDVEPGIAGPGAFQETVLETWRAFDEEHMPCT